MPETDALGLDYCISTPEVRLIQSQSVHSEHMDSGTTSEATLHLSGMCRFACHQRRVTVIIMIILLMLTGTDSCLLTY